MNNDDLKILAYIVIAGLLYMAVVGFMTMAGVA